MKRDKNKTSLLILFIILTLSLSGCGIKSQVNPNYQDVHNNQTDTINNSWNITAPPDNKDYNRKIITGIAGKIITQSAGQESVSAVEKDSDQEINAMNLSQINTGEKGGGIVFKKVSETVYATVSVNIRSAYTTSGNNVVAVLKKGNGIKRIGFQKEWSKVIYQNKVCYIKSDYLTLKKPAAVTSNNPVKTQSSTASKTSDDPLAADLKIASKIKQLIIVIGNGGSSATVSFHTKDDKGNWHEEFSVSGDVGYNGITYHKKEGDKKTPAGLFPFTVAFGVKPDPGAKLSYHKVTIYDYWVDDMDSPYYNTWVNSKEIPGNYTSEHLIDHIPSYNYAVNINTNPKNIPGLGSAIFLHCKSGSGRTTGCVAVSEKYMKTLIQKVDSTTRILIVPGKADLAKY